ncbi:MAG TPA: DUF4920 domain-containing protein [Bryobacteraceae bacterium]|nr:DUF4920 domain-containing protein [Bryobacteraceae bacterium]
MRRSISAFALLFAFVAVWPAAAETKLGQPLTLKEAMPVGDLMTDPAAHVGKVVQVSGKVTETCQMMGCWMSLTDAKSNRRVRIKVKDGEMVFPKSAVGKMAIAEGTLVKLELTREQAIAAAKHEAEEQGRSFNPGSIKSGTTIYQIAGTSAVLLD